MIQETRTRKRNRRPFYHPALPLGRIEAAVTFGEASCYATKILREILEGSGRFSVQVSTSPPANAPEGAWARWRPEFAKCDVVLSNFNGGHKQDSLHWPREVEKALEDYVSAGGGLVIYHSANNSFPNWPAYNEMIGLGWRDKGFGPSLIVSPDEKVVVIPKGQGRNPGHGPEHDFQVTVLTTDHPITKGLPKKWLHPNEAGARIIAERVFEVLRTVHSSGRPTENIQ